jgi:cytochrome c553
MKTLLGAALILASAALPAQAGDVKAGRQKALQCQNCHGMDGLSKLPGAPNLAGQPVEYLVKSLTEYKTGERKNELMTVVAGPLSEADIQDLSAYYAAIEIEVVSRPQ